MPASATPRRRPALTSTAPARASAPAATTFSPGRNLRPASGCSMPSASAIACSHHQYAICPSRHGRAGHNLQRFAFTDWWSIPLLARTDQPKNANGSTSNVGTAQGKPIPRRPRKGWLIAIRQDVFGKHPATRGDEGYSLGVSRGANGLGMAQHFSQRFFIEQYAFSHPLCDAACPQKESPGREAGACCYCRER